MLNIFDESVLQITKGNSADISITLTDTDTGDPIVIEEGDYVLFTVKDKRGTTVIKHTLTPADISEEDQHSLILSIEPEETMLVTGEYLYDVLLVTSDGQAVTFISSSLIIEPAVGLTITANGTISGASAMIRLFTNTPNTFGGMWLSGSPSVSGCSIRIEKSVSPWSTIAADTGNGATVTPDTASNVYAYAQTTVSVSNVTFKPMICTKNDWLISKNYTPPALTNAELTAKTIKFVDIDCYLNNLVFTRSYGTGSNDGSWYTTANDSVSVPGLSTIYSVSICGWESLLSTDTVQPYITANGTKIAFISNTDSFRAATYLKIRAIGI